MYNINVVNMQAAKYKYICLQPYAGHTPAQAHPRRHVRTTQNYTQTHIHTQRRVYTSNYLREGSSFQILSIRHGHISTSDTFLRKGHMSIHGTCVYMYVYYVHACAYTRTRHKTAPGDTFLRRNACLHRYICTRGLLNQRLYTCIPLYTRRNARINTWDAWN
jgi:hypothetical protein